MNFEQRRLHPLGIAIYSIRIIKDFSVPLLVFLVTQVLRRDFPSWLLVVSVVLFLAVLGIGILAWLRFTYHVKNGYLVVEHGILVRKKTVVPVERVQSIDLDQGLLQRVFGVAKVQVETAGGRKPEVVLVAVSLREAREIRRALLAESRHGKSELEQDSAISVEVKARDLLLFGATSGSGLGVVFAVFAGIWSILDDIGVGFDYELFYQWLARHGGSVGFIAFLLLLIWLFAITGIIIKYGGFRLVRAGERIHVTHGLLYRRQFSIPLRRIQAVRQVEGILRQPLGLVTLQVESAGYGRQSAEKALLCPLLKRQDVPGFLRDFLPEFTQDIPLKPLPPGTRRRYVIRALLPSALVALPLTAWLFKTGFSHPFIPLLLPALSIIMGLWNHRDAGWGLQGNMLSIRYRLFARVRVIIPRRCIQSLTVRQNPFQRRSGLVSFNVDIASKARFGLNHISLSTGVKLAEWLKLRQ